MSDDLVTGAAYLLVEDARAMLDYFGKEDPERVKRTGWRRMADHADALEAALDAQAEALSDPGANEVGGVRAGAHDTERAAAYANAPRSGSQRELVLQTIAAADPDGITDDEIEAKLNFPCPTRGRRRSELVLGGWVKDSGDRRPTGTGSPAIVWVLSADGRARLGIAQPEPENAALFT